MSEYVIMRRNYTLIQEWPEPFAIIKGDRSKIDEFILKLNRESKHFHHWIKLVDEIDLEKE